VAEVTHKRLLVELVPTDGFAEEQLPRSRVGCDDNIACAKFVGEPIQLPCVTGDRLGGVRFGRAPNQLTDLLRRVRLDTRLNAEPDTDDPKPFKVGCKGTASARSHHPDGWF
jgi:hypothetical protein